MEITDRDRKLWHQWAKQVCPDLSYCMECAKGASEGARLTRHCPNHDYTKHNICLVLCSKCHAKANYAIRKSRPKGLRFSYSIAIKPELGKELEAQAAKQEMPYQVFARMMLRRGLQEQTRKHKKGE